MLSKSLIYFNLQNYTSSHELHCIYPNLILSLCSFISKIPAFHSWVQEHYSYSWILFKQSFRVQMKARLGHNAQGSESGLFHLIQLPDPEEQQQMAQVCGTQNPRQETQMTWLHQLGIPSDNFNFIFHSCKSSKENELCQK